MLDSTLAAFPAARLVTERGGAGSRPIAAPRSHGLRSSASRTTTASRTRSGQRRSRQLLTTASRRPWDERSTGFARPGSRMPHSSSSTTSPTGRGSSVHAAYGAANNIAVRADVYAAVQFDAHFRFAGGDRDWFARLNACRLPGRLLADGARPHSQPRPSVVPAAALRYDEGAYNYRSRLGSPLRLEPSGFYASLLTSAFRLGPSMGSLVALSQAATAAGYVT